MFDFLPPAWQDLNEIQQPLLYAFRLHCYQPSVTLFASPCLTNAFCLRGGSGSGDRLVFWRRYWSCVCVCSLINVTDLGVDRPRLPQPAPRWGLCSSPLLLLRPPAEAIDPPLLWGRSEVWTVTSHNSLQPWLLLWAAFAVERELGVDSRQMGAIMLVLGLKVVCWLTL